MFSIFGRNARLIRTTEIEADRLSVVLLANAGYDPMAAARLWRDHGKRLGDGGLLAGTTHLGLDDRIALVEREAALIPRDSPRPIVPGWVDSWPQPLRQRPHLMLTGPISHASQLNRGGALTGPTHRQTAF